jgi:single-strand DNA-binding protein
MSKEESGTIVVSKELESAAFVCKDVCLSARLGWAWLQGNSRARRRRSAVPALTGFGFPPGLPASPFAEHKQSAPDPPKNSLAGLESGPLRSGSPQPIGARKEDKNMLCKNRITLIGFLGQDAESRSTPNGTTYTRLSLATSVSWKEKGSNEYKTRTEWHRIISWNKLAEWAGTLQKGAYIEVEGELRYREYTPAESDRSVRVAEIHATSILALDRSDRQPVSTPESEPADEPID